MYTNATLISKYLQRALTDDELGILAILIPAVKLWIDRKTSSTFDQASETTRYFDGGGTIVDIDPATAITDVDSVNTDNTDSYDYTDLTEYLAEPQNETVKRYLVKRDGHWPSGTGNIKVTAKFSEYDDEVPVDIQLVATILAAEVINQGSIASSGGTVASESLEGHSITYDTSTSSLDALAANNPNVQSILDLRKELLLG